MGFTIFRNSDMKDLKIPQIHMEVDLTDKAKVIQLIDEQRLKRGVLVYGNEENIANLDFMGDYIQVTEDTPDEELRSMGKKVSNQYPVKLISKKYGLRGLDYRAPGNPLGICLIILASCTSIREFL